MGSRGYAVKALRAEPLGEEKGAQLTNVRTADTFTSAERAPWASYPTQG